MTFPNDERRMWLVNLNKDSKQDILVHRVSETGLHRFVTLIAQ